MKCPRCGTTMDPMEGETHEDFQQRWEDDECDCPPGEY